MLTTAGAISFLPLSGASFGFTFTIEGDPPPRPGEEPAMQTRVVTPDFFKAMGVPLLRGRGFTAADNLAAPQVVLLSDAAVKKFFPSVDPIGRRIRLGGAQSTAPWLTIVGVSGDMFTGDQNNPYSPTMYRPFAQSRVGFVYVTARTAGPPLSR